MGLIVALTISSLRSKQPLCRTEDPSLQPRSNCNRLRLIEPCSGVDV